jgi:hypothetical protein
LAILTILPFWSSIAAPTERKFDGVWVGTETILRPFKPQPKVVRKRAAKIIIAEGGTILAVAEGHCQGRYADVHHVNDSLLFQAGDCKLQVSVSADGTTLSEKGVSTAAVDEMSTVPRGPVQHREILPVEITGTFHREK